MFALQAVFSVIFQMTSGNITFIYFADVCSDGGIGYVLSGLFGMNIVMAFTVSYLIESAAGVEGTFWIYSGLNALCTIFVVACIKETKGLNPE